MSKPIRIDIFSDPACPWCLLGLTRLDNALARRSDAQPPEIIHHPFLLDANVPEEGQNVVEMLTEKYGKEPFEMWDRIEAEAQRSGLVLDMRKQPNRYPTQKAQVLIQAAIHKGTQHQLALAMSHAYYLDASDLSDPAVLIDLGVRHGLTEDEVKALISAEEPPKQIEEAARQASESGISGVPFFIFANAFAVSGAQPDEVFDEALQMAAEGRMPTPEPANS